MGKTTPRVKRPSAPRSLGGAMPRYVKAYESLFDHELFRDRFSRRDAWLWLITRARWRDQSGGGLKRGQVLGARSFLAAEWGWGEQEVRTFLAQLVARSMVEINQQGSRRPAIITICNYEKFQGTDENDNPNPNQHLTSTQPAPNQHLTTLEERKKDRREEEDSPGDAHAREDANRKAREAYERGIAIKQGVATKSARATLRGRGELDGSQGITFDDGKLTVVNGAASALMTDFPSIDLAAVCDRAAPEIAKLSWPTRSDAMACLRKWARIVSEDAGRRPPGPRASPQDERLQRSVAFQALLNPGART